MGYSHFDRFNADRDAIPDPHVLVEAVGRELEAPCEAAGVVPAAA